MSDDWFLTTGSGGDLTEASMVEMMNTMYFGHGGVIRWSDVGDPLSFEPTHIIVPWRNAKAYWRATLTKRRWRRLRGKLKGRGV